MHVWHVVPAHDTSATVAQLMPQQLYIVAQLVEMVVATALHVCIVREGQIITERILYTYEGGGRLMQRTPIEQSEGNNSSRIQKKTSHNDVGAQKRVVHSTHTTTHNQKGVCVQSCIMKLVE